MTEPDRRAPHTRRIGALLQSWLAVLIIAVLVTGFLFLIAARRSGPAAQGPVVQAPGRIVALSGNGIISTLDGGTGKVLWSYETHQQVINEEVGLVVRNQVVYSLINGQVSVLRLKDGSLLWHYDVHLTPPTYLAFNERLVVDQGVVYVGEIYGEIKDQHGPLYALRASDGKLLWKYETPAFPLLAAKNGIVYVRAFDPKSSTWKLLALRATDGKVLWSTNIGADSAVVANDTVYALSVDESHGAQESIKAIRYGAVLWSKLVPAGVPSIEERLYLSHAELIAGGNGKFCAYKMSDGTQEWCTQPANSSTSASLGIESLYPSAAIADDALYNVNVASAEMTSYQLKNGSLRWSKQLSNENGQRFPSFPRPVVTGNVVAASVGGKVRALRISDGRDLWQTELPNVQILATES